MDLFDYLITGAVAVAAWLTYKFLLLMRYRASVLKIISSDLKYEAAVPGFQGKIFLDATRLSKLMGGNEYDAAIIFMLAQLGAMTTTDENKKFKMEKYELIENIIPQSKCGAELIEEHIRKK